MTNGIVNTRLVPTAAALIGVVYDHGPDAVNAVLRRIPDTSRDELLVLLAAMVDPDRSPSELLAWTTAGPVKSRDRDAPTPRPKSPTDPRVQVALLSAQGFTVHQIAERLDLPVRSVARHRVVIRLMLGAAA